MTLTPGTQLGPYAIVFQEGSWLAPPGASCPEQPEQDVLFLQKLFTPDTLIRMVQRALDVP